MAADHAAAEARRTHDLRAGGETTGARVQLFVDVQVDVEPADIGGGEEVLQRDAAPVGRVDEAAHARSRATGSDAARERVGDGRVGAERERHQGDALEPHPAFPLGGETLERAPGNGHRVGLPPVDVGANVHDAGGMRPVEPARSAFMHVRRGPPQPVAVHGLDGTEQSGALRDGAAGGERLVEVGVRIDEAGQYRRAVEMPRVGGATRSASVGGRSRGMPPRGLHDRDAAMLEVQVGKRGDASRERPFGRQDPARQARSDEQPWPRESRGDHRTPSGRARSGAPDRRRAMLAQEVGTARISGLDRVGDAVVVQDARRVPAAAYRHATRWCADAPQTFEDAGLAWRALGPALGAAAPRGRRTVAA